MKRILFVCSQGMSSAIAANSLKAEAAKKGIELEVFECSTQAFEEEVKNNYDLAMVAPQIRHRYDTLKELADEQKVPCVLITPQGYSPLGGNKLLQQVIDILEIK